VSVIYKNERYNKLRRHPLYANALTLPQRVGFKLPEAYWNDVELTHITKYNDTAREFVNALGSIPIAQMILSRIKTVPDMKALFDTVMAVGAEEQETEDD